MGKRKTKREKALKSVDPTAGLSIPAIVYKAPEDRTKPSEQPKLIPPTTFQMISDVMLETVPPHRNVFLSMSEYRIRDVNPMHNETSESPTHMIIFCLRLVVTDQFHPIGVVQIDKRIDQTAKLVYVWKTFLQDLSLLRLIVIGTISPPSMTFHRILRELTKIPNMKDYTGPITYSVWPYRDIVHLYDYCYLLHEIQEALYERNEMCFMACPTSEEKSNSVQLWTASWTDILLVLTSQGINCYYTTEDRNALPLDIFYEEFWKTYRQAGDDGLMDTDSKQSTDRLMELLCPFGTSLQAHKPFMCPCDLQNFYDSNEELRILLATAKYKKSTIPISCESSPEISEIRTKEMFNSTAAFNDENVSTKISNSMEIDDYQINNIFNIIDSSLINVQKSSFEIFLQKVTYDDYDLFLKTTSKFLPNSPQTEEMEAQNEEETEEKFDSVLHDHDYFRKESPEKSPTRKTVNSTIYNIINERFGKDVELLKKSLEDPKIEVTSEIDKNSPPRSKPFAKNSRAVSEEENYDHSYSKPTNLFEKNSTHEPNMNVVTSCNIKTDNFPHKRSKRSGSCEKSVVLKKGETDKNGNHKIKGSKIDHLLHTPRKRGHKVKAKRLRNKANNSQRIISNLPYILGDNLSVEDLVSGDEDMLCQEINNKNIMECNASTISEDETPRISKNQETDNLKTVAVEIRGKRDSCVVSGAAMNSNNLAKTIQPDIINVKCTNSTKDTSFNGKVQQCSNDIPVPDDNTHNKINDILKPKIAMDQSLKEPVEDYSDSPLGNMKDMRRVSGNKSEINIPDNTSETSVKKIIHEETMLKHVTKSILDSAIQDFSNILASYKKALEKSKNGRSDKSENEVLYSVNGCNNSESKESKKNGNCANLQNSDSDSIDSLTELLTSIETDPNSAKIPCKYTIPKTPNIPVKHRLENSYPKLDGMDKPTNIITQDLFFQIMQKRSLQLSQNLEETVIKHTLNMLDKTLEDCSQDFEEKTQNESPPLSNPDSLEDYASNKAETLTHFVVNTSFHENISRMFAQSNKDLDRDAERPKTDDMDFIPDLQESFLAVANSSEYTDSGLDKENIKVKNFEEGNATFHINNNEDSSETAAAKDPVDSDLNLNSTGNDKNNETFIIENTIEEPWNSTSTDIMPCCKIASTSGRIHTPSCEVNAQAFLPHYTRFRKSCSGSTSSSASIDPKESTPKEDNTANSRIVSYFDSMVDNVFNTESTGVAEAVFEEGNSVKETHNFSGYYKSLKYTVSIDEGNEDMNNKDEYEPEKPNDYFKCRDHKKSFNDITPDLVVSPVYPKDVSLQNETLNSTKGVGEPNITIVDVSMDESTEVPDKTLEKPSVDSLGFIGYFKYLENTAVNAKPSNVTSEDKEYQPDEPNDYTQYKNPSNNNAKNTEKSNEEDSNDYVDYKEYKRSLEACDNQESKCDIIYRDRKTFERLSSQTPDDFETLRVTTDWLCTFKGYIKLKEILVARKVRQFQASALSLEHIDFLVHLVRRAKNNAPSDYEGPSYTFLDLKIAFEPLFLGKGCYMITTDTDVNNISL